MLKIKIKSLGIFLVKKIQALEILIWFSFSSSSPNKYALHRGKHVFWVQFFLKSIAWFYTSIWFDFLKSAIKTTDIFN